jgi:DNA-binding NarL/FixJ family response regulator
MSISVLLVDDHRIIRDGLRALLEREPDFNIVGQAEDGLSAVRLARELQPDVVISDVSMPGLNGIEAVRRIRAESPGTRVICLSVHDDQRLVLAVVEAGASGYLLKGCSFDELSRSIRLVMSDRITLSSELVGIFVEQYRTRGSAAPQETTRSPLTSREREIVQLFSEGHSTNDIAERLHLSAKTVATHREHIFDKLQLGNIAELTRYAIREGLSSLDAPCRVGRQAA